ncbi:MAG: transcriptional regulator, partial [Nonomuraea sp.]|nr:transcriptional regulator [Nonomuraea sp.]
VGGPRARAARLLRRTLDLWRGPVLAEIGGSALHAAAHRWEELRLTVLEDWAELELQLGRHRELVGELGVLVAEHPLRERARALLMLALHGSGRAAEALEAYERGRTLLLRELGLEPGQALRETHVAILRDEPVTARAGSGARPAQLPPAVSAFTGRVRELRLLDALLGQCAEERRMPIAVLHGPAGVGKSGLIVQWAHQAAGRFPDGQLFVTLRGHDPQAPPLRPEVVLARFLRALGVPGERLPAGLDERTALFRSLLHDSRMLIVLDDAASAAQVRPLLPGAASCCVVVTSRAPLNGLVAMDGAFSTGLEPLSPEEADDLLARLAGAERIEREPAEARRIGELCDRIPLALRIVAAKLTSRPTWTLAHMAGRLQSERDRLGEPSRDGLDVRGSFALSRR